jgi:hypothetical protein
MFISVEPAISSVFKLNKPELIHRKTVKAKRFPFGCS